MADQWPRAGCKAHVNTHRWVELELHNALIIIVKSIAWERKQQQQKEVLQKLKQTLTMKKQSGENIMHAK